MPAPARTDAAAILGAAAELLEEQGLEAVTMAAVAARVGVRGPSLYKHVPNRALLIKAVAEGVAIDLARAIDEALAANADARDALVATSRVHRAFVHARPNGYGLLFAHLLPESMPDSTLVAGVARPVVERLAEVVGQERALDAARTLAAWLHGFVSMELAGAFRLGGDVDAAFEFGVAAVIDGALGGAGEGSRRGSPPAS